MERVLLGLSLLSFFLWTGFALTHGNSRTALGKTFRSVMVLLSLGFLLYTTGFELTRQWPTLTFRLPGYYFTFPHIPDDRQGNLPFPFRSLPHLFPNL
jgi:hypothetical protein